MAACQLQSVLLHLSPEFNFCYFGLIVVGVFLHIHMLSPFSKQRVPKTTDSARKNYGGARKKTGRVPGCSKCQILC